MPAIQDTVHREPVTVTNVFLALVQALLGLLTVFHLISPTADQSSAVMVFASAVMAVVNVTFVRQQVTPLHSPRDRQGNTLVPHLQQPSQPEVPAPLTPAGNPAGF